MPDKTPIAVDRHTPSTATAVDGTLTDITTCMTDDNIILNCFKLNKDDKAIRIEFQDDFPPDVDDTITIHWAMGHNIGMGTDLIDLYAHDAASTVSATAPILGVAVVSNGSSTFTLVQSFIDELVQFNTDRWAVRVWGGGITGDVETTESRADITVEAGPGVSPGLRTLALTGAGI